MGGNGPRCLLGGSASWVHCDADHSGPGGLQHYVTSETSIGPWFLTPFIRYKEYLWPWLLSANTFEWVFRNFLYCRSQLCSGPVSSPHLFACPRPQVHISHLDPASLSWVGHHVGSTTGGVCLHLDSEERAPRASPVMQNHCKKELSSESLEVTINLIDNNLKGHLSHFLQCLQSHWSHGSWHYTQWRRVTHQGLNSRLNKISAECWLSSFCLLVRGKIWFW